MYYRESTVSNGGPGRRLVGSTTQDKQAIKYIFNLCRTAADYIHWQKIMIKLIVIDLIIYYVYQLILYQLQVVAGDLSDFAFKKSGKRQPSVPMA